MLVAGWQVHPPWPHPAKGQVGTRGVSACRKARVGSTTQVMPAKQSKHLQIGEIDVTKRDNPADHVLHCCSSDPLVQWAWQHRWRCLQELMLPTWFSSASRSASMSSKVVSSCDILTCEVVQLVAVGGLVLELEWSTGHEAADCPARRCKQSSGCERKIGSTID